MIQRTHWHFVYRTIHLPTGRFYIGKHSSKINPLKKHDGYFGSGVLIANVLANHPIEEFEREILVIVGTEEEVLDYERQIVDWYLGDSDCLNLYPGGQNPRWQKAVFDESKLEERQKFNSESRKEVWKSADRRRKVSESVKKVWESADHRNKIQCTWTEEKRKELSQKMKVRAHSDSHRFNLSKRYYETTLNRVKKLETKFKTPKNYTVYREALDKLRFYEKKMQEFGIKISIYQPG